MTISNNHFFNFRNVIGIEGNGTLVSNNKIERFGNDAINIVASNLVIRNNRITDGRHTKSEPLHADVNGRSCGEIVSPCDGLSVFRSAKGVGPAQWPTSVWEHAYPEVAETDRGARVVVRLQLDRRAIVGPVGRRADVEGLPLQRKVILHQYAVVEDSDKRGRGECAFLREHGRSPHDVVALPGAGR